MHCSFAPNHRVLVSHDPHARHFALDQQLPLTLFPQFGEDGFFLDDRPLRHVFARLKSGGFGVALLNRGKVIEGAGTNGDVHVQADETNSGLRLITFVEGEAKGRL